MIFRFTLISDEVEDFIREYKIDSDATFYDLHQVIQKSCCYQEGQITSFFLCNEAWEKEQEIVLEDMGTSAVDEDLYVMRNTLLSELLEEEKQRMIFVFDPLGERMFFMELTEIIFGEQLEHAVCSRQHGVPPSQFLIEEAPAPKASSQDTKANLDLDEEFYGADSFDNDEFDPEGFDVTEDKS